MQKGFEMNQDDYAKLDLLITRASKQLDGARRSLSEADAMLAELRSALVLHVVSGEREKKA